MLERPSKLTSYRFDQLADHISQRVMPAEADVERYVGLEHLDPDSLRIRRWGDPSEVESTKLRFEAGDIIFGKRRVYQRKVAVADTEGICSAHAMVLRAKPDTVLPEFLPFFMQSELFMERALSISVGSLSPTINWRALAKEEFLLPSIQEQVRYVEAFQAMSSSIECHKELLSQFDPLLQRHFGNVIEGDIGSIPECIRGSLDVSNWKRKSLGELCVLGSGNGFRPKDWSERGMPIIRIQNVRGSADFNYFAGETEPKWIVEPGELLFSWAGVPGVSFGPGIWNGPTAVLNQHIYRVTPKDFVDRDWLYEVLLYITPKIERRAHGFKSSLLHIKKIEFTSQSVLVPTLDDQRILAHWIQGLRQQRNDVKSRTGELRTMLKCLQDELTPNYDL
ncbi:restriction endonuclease subunit S [Pseudovibrio sp. Tun.PSC04-5.I4]|uniref:restriction endonuclease subunit S n=1 Tax=Pseudovibrio sp. Tun.PSC04-5.I4 TaxID=1798213 RepID=UPI00088CD7A0|nr:restriction endonuclease subunit S [Pseudovibrio sp. Tun.PSC04-5.I4]SDR39758.1 Type I restriction modification DNA specificity domain-containing protein [Pseudovibrio sp. Tun.PSC04-5.I4]